MKIKTSELIGRPLDWAVAVLCNGVNHEAFMLYYDPAKASGLDRHGFPEFHYSTVWSQGGPIIDREGIQCGRRWSGGRMRTDSDDAASATLPFIDGVLAMCTEYGPTPLIAAMRCHVASRMGDEVDVPEDLL